MGKSTTTVRARNAASITARGTRCRHFTATSDFWICSPSTTGNGRGSDKQVKLTAYEFDFFTVVNFGASEGIYLRGKFDESGRYQLNVGTIKTLRHDLEAMKLMGELGGVLTYYADRYVNQHLHRYTPLEQLQAEAERMKAADSTERTARA